MQRIWSAGLLAIAGTLLASGAAGAQTWSTLPNGELGYTTPYAFTGGFACGPYPSFVGASCTNVGDGTIHLASGDATIDLAFTGTSGTFTATNVTQTLPVGTVTITPGGTGAFTFPNYRSGYLDFFFTMGVSLSGVGGKGYYAYSTGPVPTIDVNCCLTANTSDLEQHFASPPPAGYTYSAISYEGFSPFTVGATAETIPLTVQVGIIPEPTSFALLGTGLVALVPFVRRRRPR